MTKKQVVANIHYAVEGGYADQLQEAERTGQCIFCSEKFQHGRSVLASHNGWFARRCNPPTKDTEGGNPAHHFLIVNRKHRIKLNDYCLSGAFNLITHLLQKHGILGGGFAMRFGDPRWSGATILHPHIHVIVPRRIRKGGKIVPAYVNFPIG